MSPVASEVREWKSGLNRRLHETSLLFVLPTYFDMIVMRWLHDPNCYETLPKSMGWTIVTRVSWSVIWQIVPEEYLITRCSARSLHSRFIKTWSETGYKRRLQKPKLYIPWMNRLYTVIFTLIWRINLSLGSSRGSLLAFSFPSHYNMCFARVHSLEFR